MQQASQSFIKILRAQVKFNEAWNFPLLAKVPNDQMIYTITPRSDIEISYEKIPRVLVEVCSDQVEGKDHIRLLIQAGCVVRLANLWTEGNFFLMAIYVDKSRVIHRHLVYQPPQTPDVELSKVYYTTQLFYPPNEINIPNYDACKFVLGLYNFVDIIKKDAEVNEYPPPPTALLKNKISSANLPHFSGKTDRDDEGRGRKRRKGGGRGGGRGDGATGGGADFADPEVLEALWNHQGLEDLRVLQPGNPRVAASTEANGKAVAIKLQLAAFLKVVS